MLFGRIHIELPQVMTVRDAHKLILYWVSASKGDIKVAKDLYRSKHFAYALFFCHLAIEKMLKALVVSKTNDHAPWTHNLPFLAGRAGIEMAKDQMEFLAEMTRWNLEARYPSDISGLKEAATPELARARFKDTEEFLKWLKKAL